MFCRNCGQQNNDNARFCTVCGNALEVTGVNASPAAQEGFAQPMPNGAGMAQPQMPPQPQKRKTGLIIGIVAACVAVVVAVGALAASSGFAPFNLGAPPVPQPPTPTSSSSVQESSSSAAAEAEPEPDPLDEADDDPDEPHPARPIANNAPKTATAVAEKAIRI